MMVLVSTNNQYLSRFSLWNALFPLSSPAIPSRTESRLEVGMASDSLTTSPSLAPASSSNSFGMMTANELPTFLIRPIKTFDKPTGLLRNNYISTTIFGYSVPGYGFMKAS